MALYRAPARTQDAGLRAHVEFGNRTKAAREQISGPRLQTSKRYVAVR